MKAAVIFDFDDTLCPDSTNFFLKGIGVETEQFWQDCRDLVEQEEYDPVLAYMQKIVELKENFSFTAKLNKQQIADTAANIPFFPGVKELFSNIRQWQVENKNDLTIEYYIISSGLDHIIQNSVIADDFKAVYASAFAYNANDEIKVPKRALSFTDKTRYLFAISKGLSAESYLKNPWLVNCLSDSYEIPFSNMIYIGDGYSDVPCFALLKKYGGFPFAVYNDQKSTTLKKLLNEKRINDAALVDYSKGRSLFQLITKALEQINND